MSELDVTGEPPLPTGPLDGPKAFRSALRQALAAAACENWHEMVLSDADFADWPLGERAVIDALQAWAGAGRKLHLLAQRFDLFARGGHPRFVQWRRRWDHIIEARVCDGAAVPPSALWTPGWCLRRIDPERGRGVCSAARADGAALREQLEECRRQGRPGFAASTLGL